MQLQFLSSSSRDNQPREILNKVAASKACEFEADESVTLAKICNKTRRHKAFLPQDVKFQTLW